MSTPPIMGSKGCSMVIVSLIPLVVTILSLVAAFVWGLRAGGAIFIGYSAVVVSITAMTINLRCMACQAPAPRRHLNPEEKTRVLKYRLVIGVFAVLLLAITLALGAKFIPVL